MTQQTLTLLSAQALLSHYRPGLLDRASRAITLSKSVGAARAGLCNPTRRHHPVPVAFEICAASASLSPDS